MSRIFQSDSDVRHPGWFAMSAVAKVRAGGLHVAHRRTQPLG